ncbi:MAG: Hsp70 family protein, partial [Patescibacteria group bacterium]
DANGILSVSAKDKATGKSQSVKIEASTALSKDEIERLKTEAAAHAAEDEKKRKLIETRNQAESLIYLTEKTLREGGDKVPADLKESIQKKSEALKTVKEKDDQGAIEAAVQELSAELQKIGEMLYKQKDGGTDAGNREPVQGS